MTFPFLHFVPSSDQVLDFSTWSATENRTFGIDRVHLSFHTYVQHPPLNREITSPLKDLTADLVVDSSGGSKMGSEVDGRIGKVVGGQVGMAE